MHITVKQKSTVVYYYATGVPQIHYAVGDNWNTNDVNSDPAMSSISGCNDWYSYEIANPDSKEVKVTFHFAAVTGTTMVVRIVVMLRAATLRR